MHRKKAILYHTNWANYGRNFQVKDIPVQGITDIAYAFFNLKDSGNGQWVITSGDTYTLIVTVFDDRWADFENPFIGKGVPPENTWDSPKTDLGLFGQFSKLYKATDGALNVTLSIGGWTWSKNFSLAVRTRESRESLAKSIVELFEQWTCFSGVSIDWEYLSNNGINYGNEGNTVHPDDCENFAKFVELLRCRFDEKGWKHYTIAMCFTPALNKIKFDVKRLVPLLDEWHIMTYEFASQ
jgi:chitinase